MRDVQDIVDSALARRRDLIVRPDLDAYRVLHGAADGVPGLVIDRFGPVLIAQLHEERLRTVEQQARAIAAEFQERLGTRAVYRKFFVRDRSGGGEAIEAAHRDRRPWIGEAVEPEVTILENGLRFVIRPYDGYAPGLFLEQRDNRQRLRQLAAGRLVLNTFAYTCGFSVAAASGGAVSVASVDLHKRYLEWGKANLAANGIEASRHLFFCSDTFDFYRRAERQGRCYDLIILDPPTFSQLRRPARTFVLSEQLDELCRGAVRLLEPGGHILLATNDRGLRTERLEDALTAAAGDNGRGCRIVDRPPPPPDFPEDEDYSKTVIARFQ